MAAWTLDEAKAKLAEWKAAETKIASKQAESVSSPNGGRILTYADLAQVRRNIDFYANLVNQLERGGIRVRQGVPA